MRFWRKYWDVAVILAILGGILLARPGDTYFGRKSDPKPVALVPVRPDEPAEKRATLPPCESAGADGHAGEHHDEDRARRQFNNSFAQFQMLVATKPPFDTERATLRSDAMPFVGKLRANLDLPEMPNTREPRPEPPALPTPETGDDEMVAADEADLFPTPVPALFERDVAFDHLDEPLAAIVIEGNAERKTDEIMELIQSKAGEVTDPRRIKADLTALIRKRWFFNVRVRMAQSEKGPVLVYKVFERPILRKVTYVGNKAVENMLLEELTGLKVGGAYDIGANRESARRIESHYRGKGYLHASVELEKGNSPNDREVVFKIDEGPKVYLTKTTFAGNRSVDSAVLALSVENATRVLWLSDGLFDPSAVPQTIQAIKRYYHELGFFDVKVTHRDVPTGDRANVQIEYVISEGERYRIRKIEFLDDPLISENSLRARMKVRENDYYDWYLIQADTNEILAQYFARGWFLSSPVAHLRTLEEPGFVDLAYSIFEGEPFEEDQRSVADAADAARDRQMSSDEPAGLREIGRLVIEGVQTFDVEQVRDRVGFDFDVTMATHPGSDLSNYLTAITTKLRSGYQHMGFRDVAVETVFDKPSQRVVARVTEGKRHSCGDVHAVGSRLMPAEKLVRAITERSEPHRGLWEKGEPVPFDEYTASAIRKRLDEEFATLGLLSPKFDVNLTPREDEKAIDLTVVVNDEGPGTVVGDIVITGTKRDTEADVAVYLDLHQGMPYDSGLESRLRRRLWESGRYLVIHVDIAAPENTVAQVGPAVRNVKIRLREYEDAPPLTKPFSPAEQALLKLREWLERWARGEIEEDLVVTAASQRNPTADSHSAFDRKLALRMVVSPNHGQTIRANITDIGGKPLSEILFVAYPDRLVLAAPQRKAKLILPNSAEKRLVFSVEGKAASERSLERDESQPFRLSLGMGLSTRSRPKPSPFEVKAECSPAFLTSLANSEASKATFHDGVCEFSCEFGSIQVDAATGRLIELKYIDDSEFYSTITVRTEQDALKAELRGLEATLAAASVAYDAASPWKSVLEFFADEWLYGVRQEGSEGIELVQALRKLIGLWNPPAPGSLFEPWDRMFSKDEKLWYVPTQRAAWSYEGCREPRSLSRKNLAALLLPVYRRLVPKTGWLWPTGRDAALYWASGEDMPGAKLRDAVDSPEMGPLGDLFLGTNGSWFDIDLGEIAGRAGLKRLAAAAFANDYRPLLAGDSWLGEWFLSLAKALRQLDEAELKALARLLPESSYRKAFVTSCLLLKEHPEKPLEQVLSPALDSLWADLIFESVRRELTGLANFSPGNSDKPHRDDQVRPALAEEETEEASWDERLTEPEPFPDEDLELKPVPESDRIPTPQPVPISDDEIPALPQSVP